jgi:hypothetical protein
MLLWLLFAFTAPTGVAIGIAVERSHSGDRSWHVKVTQGVLESIALGILLFMAMVDMMPSLFKLPAMDDQDTYVPHDGPTSTRSTTACYGAVEPMRVASPTHGTDDDGRPPPGWYRAAVYCCLGTGAGVMCLLANWA